MNHIHIDIETYCELDISKVGAHKYIEHPTFEILMLSRSYSPEKEEAEAERGQVRVTTIDASSTDGKRQLNTFLERLAKASDFIVHAHNAAFERLALAKYGCDIPLPRWECSMVKAAYCGLPLSLKQLSEALQLETAAKSQGALLIKYFSKPCKATKINGGRVRNLPWHDPAKWEEFKAYCEQDVRAEMAVSNLLEDFTIPQSEKELYALDQCINDRGQAVDIHFAQKAVEAGKVIKSQVDDKMRQITGLGNPNSVAQLKCWILQETRNTKLAIPSLDKENVERIMPLVEGDVKTILEMRQAAGKTSVKKYDKIIEATGADGRIRGTTQFYGANRTGRWAGRLLQVQNLPRGFASHEDIEFVRECVLERDLEMLELCYSRPMEALSDMIRSTLIAPEGKMLTVSDFSAIEARVLAWLSGEQWRIDTFAKGVDIYKASASAIFNIPLEDITKAYRSRGKVAELALGYQGGINAVKRMGGDKLGMNDEQLQELVNAWRANSPNIVQFWAKLEACAIRTVAQYKALGNVQEGVGQLTVPVKGAPIAMRCSKNALHVMLPSGRELVYWQPLISQNAWGRPQLTYMGSEQTTRVWSRVDTYGGKLCENITQAVSRDLLAQALTNADKAGMAITAHVHDEIVVESEKGEEERDLQRLNAIMREPPSWATGLPLDAAGFTSKYYKKD